MHIGDTVCDTHQSFLQDNIHGNHLQNVKIHFTRVLNDTYVARVDVPFVVVGLDAPRNSYEHGL